MTQGRDFQFGVYSSLRHTLAASLLASSTLSLEKYKSTINGLITTIGKNWLADFLAHKGVDVNMMDYLAIGAGMGNISAGETSLRSETGTRIQVITPTHANNVLTLRGTFGPGNGTGPITETGIFDTSSAGGMFARQNFGVVNKRANDSFECVWEITFE